jgi:hypothetical protein
VQITSLLTKQINCIAIVINAHIWGIFGLFLLLSARRVFGRAAAGVFSSMASRIPRLGASRNA